MLVTSVFLLYSVVSILSNSEGLVEMGCHTISTFKDSEKVEAFENILGKGENAGDQHFLLFPKCFVCNPKQIFIFESHLYGHLQN